MSELERDLRYSRAIGTRHAVVRTAVAEEVVVEVAKLRRIVVGLVDRVAAQSEVITNLVQRKSCPPVPGVGDA